MTATRGGGDFGVMNIATWVERNALRIPDRPAHAVGDTVTATWAEFAGRVGRLAAGLRARWGLEPGDRVAIVMSNCPEYLEAQFAIWYAGLVAVPVNARLHREEIAYILEHSGTSVVVTDAEHAETVAPLVGVVAGLQEVVVAPGEQWDALCAHDSGDPGAVVPREAGDPAWLFYTSGTTGRPKGATLTHGNLLMASLSYL
ncbi:MAG TPA: AMP-binding protein, partial [Dermatophilaceae bacterium]|nr:AMP-binding protein [Dermatophilaceae bacterium]